MQKERILHNLGKILMVIGISMLLPIYTAIYYQETCFNAFLLIATLTALCGGLFMGISRPKKKERTMVRDGYIIVSLSWIMAAVVGMIPYLVTGVIQHPADAFFESMSGFTTVGVTVLNHVEQLPKSVLMWRSMTHWLGGMGILVLFVALLRHIGTGSMQIFKSEDNSSGNGKILPKVSDTAKHLLLIYIGNTGIMFFLLLFAGMNVFDAINHSFSAIATGGFSTKDGSIGSFDSVAIDLVMTVGMFCSGINYALYYFAVHTNSLKVFRNSLEFKVYIAVAGIAIVLMTMALLPQYHYNVAEALRYGAFQVCSVLSTTGFQTTDYGMWPLLPQCILFILLFCGGCAGSTSGSIKIDRHVILVQKIRYEINKFLHPRMVRYMRSNGAAFDDEMILGITSYFYLFIFIVVIGAYCLCAMGVDVIAAILGVLSCLSGVGLQMDALGSHVFYGELPGTAKILLSMIMLIGRLEIFTVLILLLPVHRWTTSKHKFDFES